ncbi:hypothetical protein [Nocardioides nitrophenolicus]|uniref:hypothetical protein n=1 Tax=Nocardioides nitrophenolicus TaxID=60489 RepID=UPI001959C570|nr:hypothetical protein [Nocardioides nitrophenolicus]MBM7519972.1 putative amino acid-binding ACT domain protein [Nocardioides nitrophenolicus]
MTTLGDLSAAELLAAEESGVRLKRQAEVDGLLRLLAWCDLHSVDPQGRPGGDRLVRLGGEGTPETSELCLAEFAVASHAGWIATSHRAAAALDLRHRLPRLWERVQRLDVEVWVARKIADLSRKLSRAAVEIVDISVAAARDLTPGKLIELAEARVIEADPAAHRERIAAEEARIGVFARRRRPGDAVVDIDGQAGVQPITLRLPTAGAVEFTTSVDEVARALADQHVPDAEDDVPTMDQFRAHAVELLADPYAAVRFLEGLREPEAPPAPAPTRAPRKATLYVHLDAAVLAGFATGVARVEDLGPMLLEQVAALLRHRSVALRPVIDLNAGASVDAYEHPAACKERTHLRTGGDVFPHSTSRTRRLDHDHVTPYDKDGPPGQTGDLNDAPLTRRHHRAKTHLPYRTRQLGLGAYRWETPHGLLRVVSRYGTTAVEPVRMGDGTLVGEVYAGRYDVRDDVGAPAAI